ncbi:PadR family transcriptional regulator [Streptomyces sp. NPDC057302]|uniref:PadR family transcriptional regulator n=1 Tax=Streptomyces sp. NPDC057302 TaxID=3346094 RepID=UPI00363DE83E
MAEVSSAWLRAALPLCLLGMLERGESYGYALLQELGAAGLTNAKAATLYPALTRLEEEGAVDIRWSAGEGGPGRKYYRLTEAGRERLVVEYRAWRHFDGVVTALAGGAEGAEDIEGSESRQGLGEDDDSYGRQGAEA